MMQRVPAFLACRSALFTLLAAAAWAAPASAQGPHPLTAAERQHVDDLLHRMTLEQKIDYIGGTGFAIRGVPSLGIPPLEMSDGPYGTRSNSGFPSTTYTAGIGLAASWDRDLAARVGGGIGRDARARGVHFMLGPGVNIYRSPRNGRNFEYFGEDPFLAAQMAVGYITGMQQQGVSATVKHFLGNNSEFLRHDSDSVIDERALREIYLPTFEAAVNQAHVGSVMDSYNLINGQHATQNGTYNIDLLRKEWKYTGVLMSDWDATYDGVAAANGGLDLEMPTGRYMNQASLLPAIKAGTVTEATLDEKVRRILSTAQSFGWLDPGHQQRDSSIPVLDAKNNAVALDSARESIVLLKNNGNLLPLDRAKVKTILVVGPDAYPGVPVGGGSAGVVPFRMTGPMLGITEIAGSGVTVLYDEGVPSLQQLARETHFTTTASGERPGLLSETFSNKQLSGASSLGMLRQLNVSGPEWGGGETLDGMPVDAAGSANARGRREQPKSHRITGFYKAESAGPYLIAVSANGENTGNRVYLDDKLVIDDWQYVRAFEPHLTLPLSAGVHKVVVETWQGNPFGARLRLAILPEQNAVTARSKELAAKADVVVVAAGFQTAQQIESEGEGGDRTFDLPYGQDAMIRAMAAANPKSIVSLTSGGNVDSTTWIDSVPALLESWYGGQSAGQALAEVLFGVVNPSGRLPVTFEARAEDNPTYNNYYPPSESGPDAKRVFYKEGIFVGYRGYEKSGTKPLFPFGYGLSYTTFQFSNLKLANSSPASQCNITATFDVKNTGKRKGAQVAQVYVSDDHAKVPRPLRELKGFSRVELAPGETKHVSVQLNPRSFAYYDVTAKKWTIDPGRFTIQAGDSVDSLPLRETIEISADMAANAPL